MLLLFLLLVVSQVGLLVFAPLLSDKPVFKWYYERVYCPLFTDYSRHRWKFWVVPLFYLSILLYCTYIYYKNVRSAVEDHLYVIETVFIPFMIAFTLLTGVLSVFVKPLEIIQAPRFEPDYSIFYPGINCQTCHAVKVPRSKHCSLCRRCIPLQDHHCIWINNCVGYGNYEYFYPFLLANCTILSYASLRLFSMLRVLRVVNKHFLSLFLLTTAFALLAIIFTYYQLKLVQEGMTNNEQDKWYLVHEHMRNGNLFKDNNGSLYYRTSSGVEGIDDTFYSTNLYDHRKYKLNDPSRIHSAEELTNIYDRGDFWKNLVDRISVL